MIRFQILYGIFEDEVKALIETVRGQVANKMEEEDLNRMMYNLDLILKSEAGDTCTVEQLDSLYASLKKVMKGDEMSDFLEILQTEL